MKTLRTIALRGMSAALIAAGLAGAPNFAFACGIPDLYAAYLKQWPAAKRLARTPAAPDFDGSPDTRQLDETRRRLLRAEAARGANYAGIHRLVRDDCRGCSAFYAVNLVDGRVHKLTPPVPHARAYYHRSSDLLVLVAGGNRTFYVLRDGRFRAVPAPTAS